MDFSTALPVLLVLLCDPTRNREDVATAAIYLESFLVRRMVCGLNTGMYGLFFVDIMNAVVSAPSASSAIMAMLLQERSDSTRWPDDEEFGQAWRLLPVYKTLKRSRLTMILRALEGALRDPELTDPVAVPRTLSVEHVMPQRWEQWWPVHESAPPETAMRRERLIHTIGNLTLLKQKLNEKLSNAPWTTEDGQGAKRTALRQHGLMKLNTSVTDCLEWDDSAIMRRSEMLLAHAVSIWIRPARPTQRV
jgi:hypothetical protein